MFYYVKGSFYISIIRHGGSFYHKFRMFATKLLPFCFVILIERDNCAFFAPPLFLVEATT